MSNKYGPQDGLVNRNM